MPQCETFCCGIRGSLAPVDGRQAEELHLRSFVKSHGISKKYNALVEIISLIDVEFFDEVYLDRIFMIFQSLHDRQTYEGTGIGLAISKKIIEKHNGIITAKSTEGSGASFIIVLPLETELE